MVYLPIAKPKQNKMPLWKILVRLGALILLADTFGNLTTEGYEVARGFIIATALIAITHITKK